jgi:hypothetical protein
LASASTVSEDSLCPAGGTFERATGIGASELGEVMVELRVELRALTLWNATAAAPAGATGSANASAAIAAVARIAAAARRRIGRE